MAYSGVFTFGDSLVDAGNALGLAEWYGDLTFSDLPDGAPTEELGYFEGRFTNGFTFADLLSNKYIGAVTKPVFPYGYVDPWLGLPIAPFAGDPNGNNLNFAYGGAQVRQGDEAVLDLDGQTDTFKDAVDNRADPNALYIVTMGGNDVRNLVPSSSDPVPEAEAHAALDAVAEQLLDELGQIVAIGVRNIVITGIPDVGLIPRYDRDGNLVLDGDETVRAEAATAYSGYLDNLIRTEVVPALQALGANVTFVQIADVTDASGNVTSEGALSLNMPTLAALHRLSESELRDNLLQHQELLFFDQIHPTAQAHALLASYMHSQITGSPWIERLPIAGTGLSFTRSGSIAAVGEVDTISFVLVAGTTYTLNMLGMSSLGTSGTLGDGSLRILGPGGAAVAADDDSGAGFDATITFTATTSGTYTVQLSGIGAMTGAYRLHAGDVSGAAMLQGDTYVVTSSTTGVIEGVGGAGLDIIQASVSYSLSRGSEIEALQTTSDRGKSTINLTGNEFDQTVAGNAGANRLDGKEGNDVLIGGAGKDSFAFTSPLGATRNVDRITDFSVRDDTILLDDAVFAGLAPGNLPSGSFARGAGAVQADDRIIYDPSTGNLFFDPDGIGGADQILFATVGSNLKMTASDFIVI